MTLAYFLFSPVIYPTLLPVMDITLIRAAGGAATCVWETSDNAEPKAVSRASHSIPHPVGDKGGIQGKALKCF